MTDASNRLRVALAQLNFRVGDVDANTERMLESADRAREAGADLVVFSELAVFGYPPRDIVRHDDLVDRQREGLEKIAAATDENFGAVVGVVDRHEGVGHRLINGAAFCSGGDVRRVVAKQLLPNYDVFDECRYFHPASTDGVVDWKGHRIGLTVCEDAWYRVERDETPNYGDDPVGARVESGAQLIVNIAASPFSLDKGRFRRRLLADHCRRHDRPLLFVNQVGANDELIFDGRSLAMDGDGEVVARLAQFEPDFQIVEVDADGRLAATEETPLRQTAGSRTEQARDAIVLGIRDYTEKTGFDQGAIVGMSGGIDSSVGTTLTVDALGADRVRGVSMPSKFSSDHGREDARILSENLGIEFDEIGIDGPYDEILETLQPHFETAEFGVTEENIQARIRGLYLMALSNKSDRLVMACGNKSELAVGYCTLYGDMNGALAIIGDLPKMLVYEIARLYNQEAGKKVIPRRVLEKPPSAELRPGQKDEDSLPSYEVLDEILERYIIGSNTIKEIVDEGFKAERVERVVRLIHRNEYKRSQAPPVLRVTSKAFGMGWRYPLAASYER